MTPLERFSQIRDLQKYFDDKEVLEMSVVSNNLEICQENGEIMELLEEYVKEFISKEDFSLDYIQGLLLKLKLYRGIEVQTSANLTKMLVNLLLNTIVMPNYLRAGQTEKNYQELKSIVDRQIKIFEKKIVQQLGSYNLELGNINELSQEIANNREDGVNLLRPRRLYIGEGFGLNTFIYKEDIDGYEIRIPISLDCKINKSKRKLNKDKLSAFICQTINDYAATLERPFNITITPQNDISDIYGNGENVNYLTISISRQIRYDNANDVLTYLRDLVKINNFLINRIAKQYGLATDKRVKLFSSGGLLNFTGIDEQIQGQAVNVGALIQQNGPDFESYKMTDKNPVYLKDVGGQKEAKKQIEQVLDMMRKEELYKKVGAKVLKGIVFEGPTGTGKTLLARVIATEMDAIIYNIKASDIQSGSHLNEGAKNMKLLFKFLREKRKKSSKRIIVIFDEMDTLFAKRGSSINASPEDAKAVNAFLSEQNGMDDIENVIFIGTTNRVDMIDPAVMRRFENEVKVGLPDHEGLLETYKIYIDKLPAEGKKLFSEVDIDTLATKSKGLSQSQVEVIVNKLLTKKVFEATSSEDIQHISYEDVDEIIKEVKKEKKLEGGGGIGFIKSN